jgi:zinc/manganese transport system substrate-binding protein
MKKTNYIIIAAVLIVIIVVGTFTGIYLSNHSTGTTPSNGMALNRVTGTASSNGVIQVVAAENFWGSLVSQLGGTHVNVTSIVTDPNADPHEYESNAEDAIKIANAQFVIVNGAGYDNWALQLIAASASSNQVVLNVQEFINQTIDANPHFWYSPYYVNDTVAEMYNILCSIEPSAKSYFTQQYAILKDGNGPNDISLSTYNARIDEIRQDFAGVKVGSTESIFVYLANATGLDLVSPPAFMEAVAEGNDPPAQSIVQFDNLITNGTITVLVYNEQTVTPLTSSIKSLAAQNDIPVVPVTETIQPQDVAFQVWMNAQLIILQNALNQQALGQ